jgi:hypothetical protein
MTDACAEHGVKDTTLVSPSSSPPGTIVVKTWRSSATTPELEDTEQQKPTMQHSGVVRRKYASASMSRISGKETTSHLRNAEVRETEHPAATNDVIRTDRGKTRTNCAKIGAADDRDYKSLARGSKASRFVSGERIPFRRRIFWHQTKTKFDTKLTSTTSDTKNDEVAEPNAKTGRLPTTATLADESSASSIRKQNAAVCRKRSACSLPTSKTRRRGYLLDQQQLQIKIGSKPVDETMKQPISRGPGGAAPSATKSKAIMTSGVDPKAASAECVCGTGSTQSHLIGHRLTSAGHNSLSVDCHGACAATSCTTIAKLSTSRHCAASADAASATAAIRTLPSSVDNAPSHDGTVTAAAEIRRLVACNGQEILMPSTGEEAAATSRLNTATDRAASAHSLAVEVKDRNDAFRRLDSATDSPDVPADRHQSSKFLGQRTAIAPPSVDHNPSASAASDAVQPLLRELLLAHDTRNQAAAAMATPDGNWTSTGDELGAKIINVAASSAGRSKAALIEAWLIDVNRHRIDDVAAVSYGAEFSLSQAQSSALPLYSAEAQDRRTSATAQSGACCEMPSDKLAALWSVTSPPSP